LQELLGVVQARPHGAHRTIHNLRNLLVADPLLESPGYEPLALGMRTARPYIGLFAWAETPADFAQLARRVPLRR
jgi:hypothetical protein